MKNTRHLRILNLLLVSILLSATTSCGNFFWKPEQKVIHRTRGPLALPNQLGAQVQAGRWTTTLHNVDGDTLAHRWEGRNLYFEKSSNQLILLVWDQDHQLVRGHRLFLKDRRIDDVNWVSRIGPRKSPGEGIAYYPYATVVANIAVFYTWTENEGKPFWMIGLLPAGILTDIVTGIVGENRARKDPRRRKTLVRILPLNDTPEWIPASSLSEDDG